MTKKCFYCGDVLTDAHFLLDKATMIAQQTYAHTDCIDSHRKENMMTKSCFFCGKAVTDLQIKYGKAHQGPHGLYIHHDCEGVGEKENTMNDQTQDILSAADYAHRSIGLARELLQESLGNMGQILTCGCMDLGPASLGSTMRLGQKLKEFCFLLADLLKDAHGLCVLLGHDLGVCEDESRTLGDMMGEPPGTPDHRDLMDVLDSEDLEPVEDGADDWVFGHCSPDIPTPAPGEEEFDDNEQPF